MSQNEYIVNSVVEFEEYAKSGIEIIKVKQSVLASVQFGFDDIASKYGYECLSNPKEPTKNEEELTDPPSEASEEILTTYKKLPNPP